ncbi:MAG: phosphonate ABC transporter, permease protein PhnE [Defluviitaleaceae bacterium]|nr:phosphonate ABC transporter, permease protein PhnE [Defluviitaleaceae bacterium]
MHPLLSIRELTKTYDGKHLVLKGLSFDVNPGELVTIVGPSGAGKSTLIRCINRLVQPTSGNVVFDGVHVETAGRQKLRQVRARIGMVFQQHNLIARTTVKKNVLHGRLGEISFFRSMLGLYAKDDKQEAEALLKTVGLESNMHQRAGTLSGGQMQRVGICRALMQRPKLLLADEPIASLDPVAAKTVMDYMQKVAHERNLTCIVNLHQVEFAKKYATRIIGLKAGRVVFDGSPCDLTDDVVGYIYGDADIGSHNYDGEDEDVNNARHESITAPSSRKEKALHVYKATRPHVCIFLLIAAILFSFLHLDIQVLHVFASFPSLFRFFGDNFLPPNFTGLRTFWPVVLDTVLFAVVGTYISAVLAFLLGLLMAQTNPSPLLRGVVRFFVSFLRNVPMLAWALVMVFVFGIGPVIGVFALVFATLGFLARSYAESINEIASTKLEAIKSSGAGYMQVIYHGLVPEFIPAWINWTLFSFEINIRASAVLGMVGAGGLGLLIQADLDLRRFRRAMALILVLVVLVLVTEFMVNIIRRILETARTPRHPVFETICRVCGVVFVIALFFVCGYLLDLDFAVVVARLGNAGHVLSRFIVFEFALVPVVLRQLLISVALAVCGLAIGCVIAVVLAFLAADNITLCRPLSWAIKGAVGLIRAVPSLVLILMVVASLGFGYTTAVVGLVFSSFGYLTRAFIASIEEQDFTIIEATRATGAGWLQVVVHGLLPGVIAAFVAWVAIRLEGNISDSISLGIVGAGGAGMLIARAARDFDFAMLSTAIVVIFVVMFIVEMVAARVVRGLS